MIAEYHFDPFYSNKTLDVKLGVLNLVSKARKFFSNKLLGLKTFIVVSINNDFAKIYLMAKGLESELADWDKAKAKAEYPTAMKSLKKFKWYYSVLEESNFFSSDQTKDLAEKILLKLYSIESKLRFIYFEDAKAVEGDEELKKTASLISINSAQSQYAI